MASETINGLIVEVKIYGTVTGSNGAQQTIDITKKFTFADGTGTNQLGQVYYQAARSLNTTNEDLDVIGSASYTDFKGTALDSTQLGLIYLENLDSDTGDKFTLKQPAANGVPGIFAAAGDGIDIGPGGVFLWVSPVDKATVTAGTGDLINVAAADNSTYKLLLGMDNT
jgi:hypothetical protein